VRDLGAVKCGIVSFTAEGKEPAKIREALARQRINVWVSLAEYTLLDMQSRNLSSVVRASVHYYNSEEEVERFCAALASLL